MTISHSNHDLRLLWIGVPLVLWWVYCLLFIPYDPANHEEEQDNDEQA
jgi:hypothetical protein